MTDPAMTASITGIAAPEPRIVPGLSFAEYIQIDAVNISTLLHLAGNTPAKENYVHSLEHGRVQFQYKPGSPQKTVDTLVAIFNEPVNGTPGYHAQVFENNTKMPYAVAAVAWTHTLGCMEMNDQVVDAMRAFRARYTDKGPEFIP